MTKEEIKRMKSWTLADFVEITPIDDGFRATKRTSAARILGLSRSNMLRSLKAGNYYVVEKDGEYKLTVEFKRK